MAQPERFATSSPCRDLARPRRARAARRERAAAQPRAGQWRTPRRAHGWPRPRKACRRHRRAGDATAHAPNGRCRRHSRRYPLALAMPRPPAPVRAVDGRRTPAASRRDPHPAPGTDVADVHELGVPTEQAQGALGRRRGQPLIRPMPRRLRGIQHRRPIPSVTRRAQRLGARRFPRRVEVHARTARRSESLKQSGERAHAQLECCASVGLTRGGRLCEMTIASRIPWSIRPPNMRN